MPDFLVYSPYCLTKLVFWVLAITFFVVDAFISCTILEQQEVPGKCCLLKEYSPYGDTKE